MPIPPAKRREQKLISDGWKRSKKGNLWKKLWVDGEEITVTVFKQEGVYKWCCHDGDAQFSEERFSSETETIEDVMLFLFDEIEVE